MSPGTAEKSSGASHSPFESRATPGPSTCWAPRTESLREEDGIHLPLEELSAGTICDPSWHDSDQLPLSRVELRAIPKVRPQPRAHPQSSLGVNSDVPTVKERVNVRSQQQAVVDSVLAVTRDWTNVRSLQRRLDLGASDCASSLVGGKTTALNACCPNRGATRRGSPKTGPGTNVGACECSKSDSRTCSR